ncbi:fibronectin type III domain-containing protein [Alkaliphilus crotonatoxidans]
MGIKSRFRMYISLILVVCILISSTYITTLASVTNVAIPSDIKVTVTPNNILIKWEEVEGATGYEIEADGETIELGIATGYTHEGLEPGTPHEYRVRAKAGEIVSVWSKMVFAETLEEEEEEITEKIDIGIPQNVGVETYETKVEISWEEVEGATGYDIEADGETIELGMTTRYTHEGLEPGTQHEYRVRARVEEVVGEWSRKVIAETLAEEEEEIIEEIAIGIPQNVEVEAYETKVEISWEEVEGATGYDIEADGEIIELGIATGYTHEELEPGTQHEYRVRAKSEEVVSKWSRIIIAETLAEEDEEIIEEIAMEIPQNVEVEAYETKVEISWEEVEGATGYDIEADGETIELGMTTSYTHEELEPGTQHEYRVRAKSEEVVGEWSRKVIAETLAEEEEEIIEEIAIGIPQNVEVEAYETKVEISWEEVEGATGYEIEADGEIIELGMDTSYTHEGLGPGTPHEYRVRARVEEAVGEWSQIITIKTTIYTITIGIPENIRTEITSNSVLLIWDEIDEATSYDIEINEEILENIKSTKYLHEGLKASTTYSYRIRAKNDMEVGEWSDLIKVTTSSSFRGSGTSEDPFLIYTKEDLISISDNLDAHYILRNNIDLENEDWEPIGSNNMPFTGSFDGGGYTISNLKIDKALEKYVGLFSYVEDATIKNLKMENVEIQGKRNVGTLAGATGADTIIENIQIEMGNVNGESLVGGLIGNAYNTNLNKIVTNVNVNSTATDSYVGGLVGYSVGLRITEIYTVGTVSGKNYTGGLIGKLGSGNIENSFALGDVIASSGNCIGGLVGYMSGGRIENSYFSGNILGSSTEKGGLVGKKGDREKIVNSYYDGYKSNIIQQDDYNVSRLTTGMKNKETYINWDFENIWEIDNNQSYPYLKNLPKPNEVFENLPEGDVAGGIGSVENPYLISTKELFNNIRYEINGHFKLINNIDLESIEWEPIGSSDAVFEGSLDGNGYTISNLSIDKATMNYVGLFSSVRNSTIQNLTIEGIEVLGDKRVGALVGNIIKNTTIENILIKRNNLSGNSEIGGLVGYIDVDANIKNIQVNAGNINGKRRVGGLVGYMKNGNLSKIATNVNVYATSSQAGGLAGYVYKGEIAESYTVGNVSGYTAGGLVGSFYGDSIKNSFALGDIETDGNYVGGLVGSLYGLRTMIENSYFSGKVLKNGMEKGGLVGNMDSGVIVNSYYDGYKSNIIQQDDYNVSRLTTGMKNKETYINWDFENIWEIDNNQSYPYLKNLPKPNEVFENLPEGDVAGGIGSIEDPYLISTKEQLNNIRFDLESYYVIVNDIDLNAEEWLPIGGYRTPFKGNIDGGGFVIKNLMMTGESKFSGLIGYAQNTVIKNMRIENVNVVGGDNTGALVGMLRGESIIENNWIIGTGSVKGTSSVGGLIGHAENGKIIKSLSTIDVEGGGSYTGGLIGYSSAVIEESYASGNVFGKSRTGGLVGYLKNNYKLYEGIKNTFALGNVSGTHYVGGLIGYSDRRYYVVNCYYSGKVTGIDYISSLIGYEEYNLSKDLYFDQISSGFDTPAESARATTHLLRKDNYIEWDFENIWDIDENKSYPFLRGLYIPDNISKQIIPQKIKAIPGERNIEINWEEIDGITGYDIEVDGEIIELGMQAQYLHEGLEPGTVHEYRVRVKIDSYTGEWSTLLKISTNLSNGEGTLENPFLIYTEADLDNVRVNPSAYFKLVNDIEITKENWEPIGSNNMPFTGSFDGGGYTISNMKIYREMDSVGLFGSIQNATIENLKIVDADVKGLNRIGILVGEAVGNDNKIIDVVVQGSSSTEGVQYTGGLIGYIEGGQVISTSSSALVNSSSHYIGGLIGHSQAEVILSYATGDVISTGSYAGGLVGAMSNVNGKIERSYASGNVTAVSYVGGLIGSLNGGNRTVRILDSFAIGNIRATTSSSSYVGGLIGYSAGTSSTNSIIIKNCYAVGTVTGSSSYRGGLIGRSSNTTITYSFFDRSTTGITSPSAQAKTTELLKSKATYIGWDFNQVWHIAEGLSYPILMELPAPNHEHIIQPESAPAGLSLVERGRNYISLNWEPVNWADEYEILVNDEEILATDQVSFKHEDLMSGKVYQYRVRAKASDRISWWTEAVTVQTVFDVPTLTAMPSNQTIILNWSEINGAVFYILEMNGEEIELGLVTTYNHEKLETGKQYTYRVKASGEYEDGEWSELISIMSVLPAPESILTDIKYTSVILRWNEVPLADGYNIEVDGTVYDIANTLEYTHSDLLPGTTHKYRLQAKNEQGTGQWSDEIIIQTPLYMEGSGTEEDPYIILNSTHLKEMNNQLNAYFRLGTDIDLKNELWEPIGNTTMPFKGSLDGNGYEIKNLKVDKEAVDYVGFFGVTENVVVKNLEIVGVEVSGRRYVGALVGQMKGTNSKIEEVSIKEGTVTGESYVGGLVGTAEAGEVRKANTGLTVTGNSSTGVNVGGLIGNASIFIIQSYATGQVQSSGQNAGGLVGYLNGNVGRITESYAAVNVNGTFNVGGLVGNVNRTVATFVPIENSFALGTVQGSSSEIGRLVGRVYGSSASHVAVKNSYAGGEVVGSENKIGGIVGSASYAMINNSYYDGIASGIVPTRFFDNSRLTSSMKQEKNYEDWDFETIWGIDEGQSYPYLKNLPMPVGVVEGLPENDVAGGKGTVGDPYIIKSKEQLNNIRYELTAHYRLGSNIDLENELWGPIGDMAVPFKGSLDGAGHEIKNLRIDKENIDNIGFFGVTENVVVKNLEINGVEVSARRYVGALVGQMKGTNSKIEEVSIKEGTVTGESYVGGLVGTAEAGEVRKANTGLTVTGNSSTGVNVGGLIGNASIFIIQSYATGQVQSSGQNAGGLVGYLNGNVGRITESYAAVNVNGTFNVGGLVGNVNRTVATFVPIENSFALGTVQGSSSEIGRLVGRVYGSSASHVAVKNSYAGGEVVGSENKIGGIVGSASYAMINNSYYDGIASGIVPTRFFDNSRLTSSMKQEKNYEDWDFETIWGIDEGQSYPYLKNLPMPVGVVEGLPENDVAGGKGTVGDPYIIKSKEQLNNIRYELTAHYRLGSNIDLENELWGPIGDMAVPFKGSLDGAGHEIKNLRIDKENIDNIGFFGVTENVVVKNLEINGVEVSARRYVGALVGQMKGTNSKIEEVSIKEGTVTGESYVGGLVGTAEAGEVRKANTGLTVTGNSSTGVNVGGLIGNASIFIIQSYATGQVQSSGQNAGGLVGYLNGNVGRITESYAAVNVNGTFNVGGLVGNVNRTVTTFVPIENSFALGTVQGSSSEIGRLVGRVYGSSASHVAVKNSYAGGEVVGSENKIGGIVGSASYAMINNSYYDGIASGIVPTRFFDNSRLTSSMKQEKNYEDWDFETIWGIDEGQSYPYLKNLPMPVGVVEGLPENDVAGGKGTVGDPYIIKSKEQLNNIRYELTAHYRLGSNIDLENELWGPIGDMAVPFKGSLDGAGHEIKNLRIDKENIDNIGFFGVTENVVVKNLEINGVEVSARRYVGALVGQMKGTNSKIEEVSIKEGTVTGESYVGGLVGTAEAGEVRKANTGLTVTGNSSTGVNVGGLIGNASIFIIQSYATGQVQSSGQNAGGLVGYLNGNVGRITESYAAVNVNGTFNVGGLVGNVNRTVTTFVPIENSFALGTVQGSGSYIGGLVGRIYGSSASHVAVKNSYAGGAVINSSNYKGGLFGTISSANYISSYFNSTSTGITTPTTQARTTEEMIQQITFVDWDFSEVWDIEDGSSYPFLRVLPVPDHENMPDRLMPVGLRAEKIESRSVQLTWRPVNWAEYYDISVDGVVVASVTEPAYLHEGLTPSTVYEYRVRARNSELVSSWTPTLKVITPLEVPLNLTVERVANGYKLTWDAVDMATIYDMEVNGTIIKHTSDTTFIHENLAPGSQYVYRVRARNSIINSKWSEMQVILHWAESTHGLAITAVNWLTDASTEDEVEIVIKAKVEDLYSVMFDLTYQPQNMKFVPGSLENLVSEDDIYDYTTSSQHTGKIRVLISRTGDVEGKEGEFDLVRIKLKVATEDMTQLIINEAKLVNAYGEYINIPAVPALNYKVLPEFELFQNQ